MSRNVQFVFKLQLLSSVLFHSCRYSIIHILVHLYVPVALKRSYLIQMPLCLLSTLWRSSSIVCQGKMKETAHPLRLNINPLSVCKTLEKLKAKQKNKIGFLQLNLPKWSQGWFALLKRTEWFHYSNLEQDTGSIRKLSESPFLLLSPFSDSVFFLPLCLQPNVKFTMLFTRQPSHSWTPTTAHWDRSTASLDRV